MNIVDLFLDYFAKKEHHVLPSSSVIPNDETILFTNAGMVQFKDWFLDTKKAKYQNVTTCQNCIRAGGKHNDLENVGRTNRHHTYFQMLGNFSFGGYFKQEAIDYAWDFLVNVLKINQNRLYATYYHTDDETKNLWKKYLPDSRIISIDTNDNFWSMGDVGPCGPCSEIFYDLETDDIMGGNKTGGVGENDRWIEIWNLVFMQYNRTQDGKMHELNVKCVDTGASVERLTAILENQNDTYKTTIFNNLINKFNIPRSDSTEISLRVASDHIRCLKIMLQDGVEFSNEGRGYVARKIARRAMNFILKIESNLQMIKGIHPKLDEEIYMYEKVLQDGIPKLEKIIKNLDSKTIPAELIFELHDTNGLHYSIINEYLEDKHPNLKYDLEHFETLLNKQRQIARANQNFDLKNILLQESANLEPTEFVYLNNQNNYALEVQNAKLIKYINIQDQTYFVFDKTICYAESGGQASDHECEITFSCKNSTNTYIFDTFIKVNEIIFHKSSTKIPLDGIQNCNVSMKICSIDIRHKTTQNHTATHILHEILCRKYNATQKGSSVNHEKLRLDFNCQEEIDICDIETQIRKIIYQGLSLEEKWINKEQIQNESNLTALFQEKYGEKVRVITIPSLAHEIFSKELCCGTHVKNTEEIKEFKIISCETISKGTKRIEAVTGDAAIQLIKMTYHTIMQITNHYKTKTFDSSIIEKITEKEKQFKSLQDAFENIKIQNIYDYIQRNSDSSKVFIEDFEFESAKKAAIKFTRENSNKIIFCLSNKNFLITKSKDSQANINDLKLQLEKNNVKFGINNLFIQGVCLDSTVLKNIYTLL